MIWILIVYLNGHAFTPLPQMTFKSAERCETYARQEVKAEVFMCKREK